MVFFLHSWRSAIVVCVAIPTSLAIALTAMKLMGLTIDTISLLGDVAGHRHPGRRLDGRTREHRAALQPNSSSRPKEAAVKGREEIGAAAVVITLVDVVVFLPIAFIPGQVGRQPRRVRDRRRHLDADVAVRLVHGDADAGRSLGAAFDTGSRGSIDCVRQRLRRRARLVRASRAARGRSAHGGLVASICARHVRRLRWRSCRSASSARSSSRATDRGEIFMQITYPIGTPLATVRDRRLRARANDRKTPDIAADIDGRRRVFGGVRRLRRRRATSRRSTCGSRTTASIRPTIGCTKFRQIARNNAPEAPTRSSFPSTGTGGGNTQPIDYLVSDVTGGDPTADAHQGHSTLCAKPRARPASTVRARARTRDVDRVRPRKKRRRSTSTSGTAAKAAGAAFGGDVATQFETPQGLEQVQVIYPLSRPDASSTRSRTCPIRAHDGSIVHLGDFARFAIDADARR